MVDRKLRLLIAEKEYLIALDASQIVESLLACDVTVAAMSELEDELSKGPWDLVLIDLADDVRENRRHADGILSAGAGIVFLTAHSDLAQGVPGLAEWPVVMKPFTSLTLADGVFRALALVGKA